MQQAHGRVDCCSLSDNAIVAGARSRNCKKMKLSVQFSEILSRGGDAESKRIAELAPILQFDEPINIQFTSGTTGFPKGATLSHHNILNNGYFIGEAMRLTPEDRLCIPVPLYHCFGMVLGNLAAVTHGACMVFPGEGFDPLVTFETVAEERCTALHGVPTMFIAQLDHPEFERFDLTSLRTGIMAGSPCPIEVMKRARRQDESLRDHHRLRHDRDLTGQLPKLDRRSAGAARLHGRPHPAASRSEDRRSRTAASCRPARPANC